MEDRRLIVNPPRVPIPISISSSRPSAGTLLTVMPEERLELPSTAETRGAETVSA